MFSATRWTARFSSCSRCRHDSRNHVDRTSPAGVIARSRGRSRDGGRVRPGSSGRRSERSAYVYYIESSTAKTWRCFRCTAPLTLSNVRKIKWSCTGHINHSKTTDGRHVTPLGDYTTRKDDKGDQPSGGETTWAKTGAMRSGTGQHKTG